MDEIEYKLNTNNSVLIVNAIDKLISTIKAKFKPSERQRFVLENEELKLLREKCSSKEAVVSLTACQGLLALVELGVLEIAHTMSTVVTLLPSAHNYSAIISTMAGLLILDLKSRLVPGTVYKCQFSLKSPKHPFITVLERNKDAEDDVFAQMQAMCNHPDYTVSSNSLELLRSVFLYMTCNPEREGSVRPWRLLLSLPSTPQQRALLIACLSCQSICSPSAIERSFSAYSLVADAAIYIRDEEYLTALLPLLARISNELVKHGRDPRACYALIERGFASGGAGLRPAAGLTLHLLAGNLPRAPALYLHDTFNLCLYIMNKHPVPSISLNSFVAQTLQWLHLPSYLTTASLTSASKILDIYQDGTKTDKTLNIPNLMSNKIFNSLIHTDRHLSVSVKLISIWERLRDDRSRLENWLDGIDSVDKSVKLEMTSFFYGLLMERNKDFESVVLRVLSIVVGLVDFKRDIAVELLPILVYKIANDTSPVIKLQCLKALPLMAKTKENVPTIVSILNKLKSGKGVPTSFLITLYLTLAETQVRCFPYLQELLVETGTGRPDDLRWEMDIAKITAVKRICELRASSHGLQLVPIVSSTLNRCSDRAGGTAASAALCCIALLWRSGALSPHSAWRALQPKLERDGRLNVQITVCKLLSELPALATNSLEYSELARSACAVLWKYLSEGAPALVQAACAALANYPLTSYTLKDIPEIYRKNVVLPSSYCKTPADAARKPEDVLDYIPCEVWPEVFKYTNQAALSGVVGLARSVLEREVQEYRSGVYLLQGLEPTTLGHLPPHSAVRGLTTFFRNQVTSPSYDCPEEVTLAVLETISSELSKPLPPTDSHHLPELIGRGGEWRRGAVSLAARCAKVSPSARAVTENWVHGLQNGDAEESDIILFYFLLPTLTRTIPPNSLRGPLERTLTDAFTPISRVKAKIPYEKVLLNKKSNLNIKKSSDSKESSQTGRESSQTGRESSQIGNESSESGDKENEEYLFIKQLKLIKHCLDCDNIHDANRTLLSQVVEQYFNVIGDDNVAWPAYVETCTSLPCANLERMSSPSGWWEVGAGAVRRAGAVRGALARGAGPSPLYWLNEIVDAQATQITEQEFSLHYIFAALRDAPADSEATKEWFLQLLARTQVAFNEFDYDSESESTVAAVPVKHIKKSPATRTKVQKRKIAPASPAAVAAVLPRSDTPPSPSPQAEFHRMEDMSSKLYLCTVFTLAVTTLSGQWALEADLSPLLSVSSSSTYSLLPSAAPALLAKDAWRDCTLQVLEWLWHTRDCLGGEVAGGCQRTLLALRHTEPFAKNHIWTRLASHFGKEIMVE